MGCCCSLFRKKNNIKTDETTPLLSKNNDVETGLEDENYGVYKEFANHLVDVESFNSYEISQREYEERSRLYASGLNDIKFEPIEPMYLLNDIPNPEVILASDPIDSADEQMIRDMLRMANEAMKDFKIEHKEDLIVQFP